MSLYQSTQPSYCLLGSSQIQTKSNVADIETRIIVIHAAIRNIPVCVLMAGLTGLPPKTKRY